MQCGAALGPSRHCPTCPASCGPPPTQEVSSCGSWGAVLVRITPIVSSLLQPKARPPFRRRSHLQQANMLVDVELVGSAAAASMPG